MTPTELTALLMLATATSFTPGPNTTLSTALAANKGLTGAMHFVLAVPVGWGLLLSLCMGGVGSLVMTWPALRTAIVLGGIVYLLWLARRLWGSDTLSQVDERRLNVNFLQGVLLQFLNIKAWMLALSIMAGWVVGHADAWSRYLQILPILLGYAFTSNFSYALAGALLRQWLAHGQRLRTFNRLMATALLLTVGWMARGLT